MRLPRKLKKKLTENCKYNLKLNGLRFKSMKIISINMRDRICEIEWKTKKP